MICLLYVPLNLVLDFLVRQYNLGFYIPPVPIDEFIDLIMLCTKSAVFTFNGDAYQQKFGVAMGSPLSPIIANLFMEMFESEYLPLIPDHLKHFFWVRYVDDIFIIYQHDDNCFSDFLDILNNFIPTLKFTTEIEENKKLPFLDVLVHHTENNDFKFSVYRKNTNTESYIHNFSYHSKQVKHNVISNLFSRAFKICDPEYIDLEIKHLYKTFLGLGYPKHIINFACSKARKKYFSPRLNSERDLGNMLVLPYTPSFVFLHKYARKNDINVAFRYNNTIRSGLTKNKDEMSVKDKGVYVIPCKDCDRFYVGETGRSLDIRIDEHKRACRYGLENSAVAQHSLQLDHRINFENTKIIYNDSNIGRRRVVKGAVINSVKTFHKNKSFSEEDNIITNFIFNVIVRNSKATHTLGDPFLSLAQAQGDVSSRRNPDAGTYADQQQPNYLLREDDEQPIQADGGQRGGLVLRRSARIYNRQITNNIPGD